MESSQRRAGMVPLSLSHAPRPLSEEGIRANIPMVIACDEIRREVSAFLSMANKQIDKTFTFDKVFGPSSKQKELYDQAISPVVNEVLEGYNCTIFAYGQTGTGKTFTMEGGRKIKNGEFPSDAGVIPRAVKQIFDMLEMQLTDYSMKESKFSDERSKRSIALMEDGKGGVFVRGLEEEVVCSASEIYKILDRGSSKRQTAETLLNKQSSRSHSIFSITIHMKESTHEGEEMIKCGKLNLVDLAGSENVMRSGAREGRAREAGEINKSLLTLGRVINALVEHSGHIPYRESKLTRLLRDSLGGKTKTCIIATISPAINCLEETLSTLEYAHRAKGIKNKHEINQKLMKSALIKDLYSEISRLRQEVYAAKEKNGVYLPQDRYLHEEAHKKAMAEKIEQMAIDLESKNKQADSLQELYTSQQLLNTELSKTLEKTQRKLEDAKSTISDLEYKNKQANTSNKEKEYLIVQLLKSEKALMDCAHELRSELENTSADVSGLFSKIESKNKTADYNRTLVQRFHTQLTENLDILHGILSTSVIQQEKQLKEMEEDMHTFVSKKVQSTEDLHIHAGKLKDLYCYGIKTLEDVAGELQVDSQSTIEKLSSQVSSHASALDDCFKGIVSEADKVLIELQSSLTEQEDKLVAFTHLQHEAHLRAIKATQSIAKLSTDFFSTLDTLVSKISDNLEETQMVQDRKFIEFTEKFEESTLNEEKQLLEKVAEIIASSNTRKKLLVQTTVDSLRKTRICTSSYKNQWKAYVQEAENQYSEGTTSVEIARGGLEEGFQQCKGKIQLSSQQWRDAHNSLTKLEDGNVSSVDSIVRRGMEANQMLCDRLSCVTSTSLQKINMEQKGFHSSIDSSLKLDRDTYEKIDNMTSAFQDELRQLRNRHSHRVAEITGNAEKCLEDEYRVEETSCSTPMRLINLPSIASVEELKTPAFEELLKLFWASKQVNGEVKHLSGAHEPQSRVPLTQKN
ncbi:Plus-end-directed kinesin ATPase protein [Dioscorea alata]|uniref:Plus-end-directed kinesin ATPase protein n=1 Tax=Dioscorea alata TaxID=55571 RepID=A0ACB7U992_DIOAL|nr:Plus-end-directed kinesin ATPase protein [Dioscorea alata]